MPILGRSRLASICSRVPWHQSSLVAASANTPFLNTLRLDSAEPLDQIVAKLNRYQPDRLVGYPSLLELLAAEQLAGKLSISPKTVFSAAEVLTDPVRDLCRRAWNENPVNSYAATETAVIASDCNRGRMHLCDDLVILEVVDGQNKPVLPGETGEKVLLTVLFSRTLPLIRYEISDRVRLSPDNCDCGLPFPTLETVEGRQEDILHVQDRFGNAVKVMPILFHRAIGELAPHGWQVVQTRDAIHVRAEKASESRLRKMEDGVAAELRKLGVDSVQVKASSVDQLQKGATGKASLIVRDLETSTGHI